MRTKVINLYSFSELPEDAQQNAIEEYKNSNGSEFLVHFDYEEAYKTVKAFNDLFGIKEGYKSRLDFSTNFDSNVYELRGLRLRKWVINNYWNDLFKPAYIGSFGDNKVVKHNRVKTKKLTNKGRRVDTYNIYYSAINRESSCPFTGTMWDALILQPILDFIEFKNGDMKNWDIEDLINECFNSLKNGLESSTEYYDTDEFISEELENMGEVFDEEGSLI